MGTFVPLHEERRMDLQQRAEHTELKELSDQWIGQPALRRYSYHFDWLGRPVIQYPQDMIAMQEVIWAVKPDLIIETGIAHGGSLIFYASLLELNALCGGPEQSQVLGIDIEIRPHNRTAIEAHSLFRRISLLEGSSTAHETILTVYQFAESYKNIMVVLDSNHTHAHVLAELEAYAPLVTSGSYCIVFDTIIENMPEDAYSDRPWGKGNNPMTAVRTFLTDHPEFCVDTHLDETLLISAAPGGYLKCLEKRAPLLSKTDGK